jgi:hypothetical protein
MRLIGLVGDVDDEQAVIDVPEQPRERVEFVRTIAIRLSCPVHVTKRRPAGSPKGGPGGLKDDEEIDAMTCSERDQAMARAYESRGSLRAVAGQFGVTHPTVLRALRRVGIERRADSGSPTWLRFTDDQMTDIIARYEGGASAQAIGRAFGTTKVTILRVLRTRNIDRRACRVAVPVRLDRFEEQSPERDYWIGFLFADGRVAHRRGHQPTVSKADEIRRRCSFAKVDISGAA